MVKLKVDKSIKYVTVKVNHPKSQLQNMISLVEEVFCFDDSEGHEGVVAAGKLLIGFIKTQDKKIKHHKIAINKLETAKEELEKYKKVLDEFGETYAMYHLLYTDFNVHQAIKLIKEKYFTMEVKK